MKTKTIKMQGTYRQQKLTGFGIVEHDPIAVRIEINLLGKHKVYFGEGPEEATAIKNKNTKLMA